MPVPKRRTSKKSKNDRRANDALIRPQLIKDKETGKLVRPHRVCLKTGRYKDQEVIKIK